MVEGNTPSNLFNLSEKAISVLRKADLVQQIINLREKNTCFVKTRLCAHAKICINILRHKYLLHDTIHVYSYVVIKK